VKGLPTPSTAGVAGNFTVTAVDAYGNVTPAYLGTVTFASSDIQAVVPANYTFMSSDAGARTFSATLKTAGLRSITATDTATTTIKGSQASISVIAAAASKLKVTTSTASTIAGAAFDVTVTAQDPFSNTATSYRGTIAFSSTDAKALYPANYTFTSTDAGVHTFSKGGTFETVATGHQTITAKDTVTATITGTSPLVTVTAASLDHFVLKAPSTTTAGSAFSATVTAVDFYGNTVTTYTGTIQFTSSDKQAVLPLNYTFLSSDIGTNTFTTAVTLKTAAAQTVTATDTVTTTVKGSANVLVNPAAAASFTVKAPASVTHGVSFTVVVTALDAYGNVATGYLGTIKFTSSDKSAALPPNYTFKSSDAGVASFTVTLSTSGTQSITVTDIANASLTGSDKSINVTSTAGPQTPVPDGANEDGSWNWPSCWSHKTTARFFWQRQSMSCRPQ
jgi:hypothetical protein